MITRLTCQIFLMSFLFSGTAGAQSTFLGPRMEKAYQTLRAASHCEEITLRFIAKEDEDVTWDRIIESIFKRRGIQNATAAYIEEIFDVRERLRFQQQGFSQQQLRAKDPDGGPSSEYRRFRDRISLAVKEAIPRPKDEWIDIVLNAAFLWPVSAYRIPNHGFALVDAEFDQILLVTRKIRKK